MHKRLGKRPGLRAREPEIEDGRADLLRAADALGRVDRRRLARDQAGWVARRGEATRTQARAADLSGAAYLSSAPLRGVMLSAAALLLASTSSGAATRPSLARGPSLAHIVVHSATNSLSPGIASTWAFLT